MRTRWKVIAAIVSMSLLGLAAVGPTTATATNDAERPTKVLIIMLDQMRPDYVNRFDMDNVRALMRGGVNFPQAQLGHMAAETVITHNAVTSGQLPKHMGWTNEVYRDVGDVLGGGAGEYYVSSSFSCDQFGTLINAAGYPKLEDYLGDGIGGDARFVSIGNKTTSSCPAGQPAVTGVDNDIIVRLGSNATLDCDGNGTSESWRGPSGVNVPSYLSTLCGRFYVNTSKAYGTDVTSPAWMYPADGARYLTGDDPKHQGGDVWAADAAIEVMRNEADWDGMLVSMPAIDKSAHMWGTDDTGPTGGADSFPFAHLPRSARIADRQVGKLLGELEAQGIDDETLVVLTTDHAGQTADRFHGVDGPGRGNYNWYFGADADETYLDPSPAIDGFVTALGGYVDDGGNVAFTYQDGHIAVWLADRSGPKVTEAVNELAKLPDVIATYSRNGARYAERTRDLSGTTPAERAWFNGNAQRLIDTMAASDGNGPDVVGLLRDDTSYGVAGDHGGHQKPVQRIPIVFDWPGLRAGASPSTRIRSVDILPTILRLMGIPTDPAYPMDGHAVSLPRA